MSDQKHVIIVAGGTGVRMNHEVPKQFIKIDGKPIITYAIEKFLSYDVSINVILVCHADYLKHLNALLSEYFPKNNFKVTNGGATRFQSVKNGLNLIKDTNGMVAIHDAARPFVSIATIKNCFETAAQKGNAIPFIPLNESLRHVENEKNNWVDRNDFKIIQTPQCFKIDLIKKAFEQDYNSAFTDDATVLEQTGVVINLVEGNSENIKITTPTDLKMAESLLSK